MSTYSDTRAALNDPGVHTVFRLWGKWISDSLTAAGWAKIVDAGQIDWAAATVPAAINDIAGYEVRYPSDALTPFYLLIEYGNGSTTDRPAIWTQISDDSTYVPGAAFEDGGVLAGTPGPRIQHRVLGSSATVRNCYISASGAEARVLISLFNTSPAATNFPIWVSFERAKDANGNNTDNGVLACYNLTSYATYGQYHWQATGAAATEASVSSLFPLTGTGADGVNVALYPIFHHHGGGPFYNPGLNCIAAFQADAPLFSTPSITLYGAAHTYLSIGANIVPPGRGSPAEPITILFRYE